MIRNIKIDSFDYPLPEERIALYPLEQRDTCKLLVANAAGRILHQTFSNLALFLKADTLIVANETKVVRARIDFRKETGARIEIFLLEPVVPAEYVRNFAATKESVWLCMIGNKKRWKGGCLEKILVKNGREIRFRATVAEDCGDKGANVRFEWDDPALSFAEILEAAGTVPIPPYLKRESEERDNDEYQTVYSRTEGSVAAPTAGLHFTPELIGQLKKDGHEFATVTLHVGAGTFQPVKSEEIGGHKMHQEWISVTRHTLRRLISAMEEGRDVLAVGTTSVRTLESLPYIGAQLLDGADRIPEVTQWMPYEEKYSRINTIGALRALLRFMEREDRESIETFTSIMIAPGFRWRIVNRLITNFHQPKSTLLLLISSFLGNDENGDERWRKIYREALESNYRFLSYGDACLFSRGSQPVELPLSKSMLIRAAAITAARNPDNPRLLDRFPDECDDVTNYIEGLRKAMESALEGGESMKCHIGEGAAPLRFLVAFAASLKNADLTVEIGESLRRRPLMPLVETLRRIGAEIEYWEGADRIRIRGNKLRGGDIEVDGSLTSQYLSALMLASPLWAETGAMGMPAVSKPYVRMTEKMLESPELPSIEPDWSGAAFFYEYALVSGKDVRISRLTPPGRSLQGDAVTADIFSSIGVNTEFHADGTATLRFDKNKVWLRSEEGRFEYDFTDTPDLALPVVVGLCYRRIPFRIAGVGHLRYKESDRLYALQSQLSLLGYGLSFQEDALIYEGEFLPMAEFPVEINVFSDHRMAMAFYPLELAGLALIPDKEVVGKSFPNFYQQF